MNDSQNLAKQKKKCKITLWFEFEVHSKHLPCPMRKCFLKTVKEKTKPRINYTFFSRENRGIGFQSPWQRPVKFQVKRPYLHLLNIYIIATKRVFLSKVIEFRALKGD